MCKEKLKYSGFIEVRKSKDSPDSLPRGSYYCESSVAKCFDPSFDNGEIEFFESSRDTYCLTINSKLAKPGMQKKESEVKK